MTENECKNHLKKHKPVLWSGTQEDFNSSINSERAIVSTEVSVETDEVNKLLFEAIETLPREKQVCLQLFYFEGADIAEIASALGIPPRHSQKQGCFVARKKLEKELKKSGVGKDVFLLCRHHTAHRLGVCMALVKRCTPLRHWLQRPPR